MKACTRLRLLDLLNTSQVIVGLTGFDTVPGLGVEVECSCLQLNTKITNCAINVSSGSCNVMSACTKSTDIYNINSAVMLSIC